MRATRWVLGVSLFAMACMASGHQIETQPCLRSCGGNNQQQF